MVAINYAKDIRVGEQPVIAAALGSNFVWPALPERLFLRGQSLVYDFIKQRYGMRRPGHFTLVVGDSPVGPGFISDNMAELLGDPEMASGSISSQPLTGIDLGLAVFTTSGSNTQLNLYFSGDVVDSLNGIRFWADGIEVEGPPDQIIFHENPGITVVLYNNPNMVPWVDGGQHIIAITLDGQELPSEYYYTTNVNDLGIVTRTSESTYWGPSGSLLEAAVDEARIQHDPVTGKALGLLVESEATNLFPVSENFADQGYTHQNVDVVPNYSEHFGKTFTLIRPTTDDAQHRIYRNRSGDGPYTATIFAKAAGYRYLELNVSLSSYGARFDLEEGEVVSYPIPWGAAGTASASIEHVGGGVYRCQYTNGRANTLIVRVRGPEDQSSFPGDGISGIEIFGLMDEEGTYPTSYIPTTDSPVTRAADDAVIDLSDVLNPDEGTYVVRAVVKDDGEIEYYAGWYSPMIPERFAIRRTSSGIEIVADSSPAGYREVFSVPGEVQVGDVITIAMAYSDGECVGSAFGEVVRDSSGGFLSPSSINLVRGVGGTSAQNNASLESSGIIAGFEYYPRALSEEELARITAFTPGDNS